MSKKSIKTGIELIRLERQRQITKLLYTAHHDDKLEDEGQLADAAVCYAMAENVAIDVGKIAVNVDRNFLWPWGRPMRRGQDRITELAKAGALIAAEIDRLQRLKGGSKCK
jgi:hypothetical protein